MNEVDMNGKVIWDYMLMGHELKPMDAIFALGSIDLRVAERAAELFLAGYGKYLICSGHSGVKHGGTHFFEKTEAESFADVARANGVPEGKILIEKESTNTGENIHFTKAMLKEKGLDFASFILVQKPFMERRTYASFKRQWPEVEFQVTSPQIPYDEYMDDPIKRDHYLNAMVGDLERIKEYPALGFQIEQEIPPSVWEAFERLVALGYNKRLIPS